MALFDLFSKRQRRLRGDVPDVYTYNALPDQLRVQIVHIIRDAFGEDYEYFDDAEQAYRFVHDALCREYGVFNLFKRANSHADALINFFLAEQSVERALDVVEICFKYIHFVIRDNYNYSQHTIRKIKVDDAIDELNARFKEHGIGFQFESGEIIRVDSEFLHAEAVKPTLAILRASHFKGANEEFLKAHEHYRHGRHKECLVEALKAFESTMKAICQKRGWAYQPGDTAKALINTCLTQGLLPSYLESQMGSLRSLLESGVPTVRNKLGGHGQGPDPVQVPEYMARYGLNLTATTILFIAEADAQKT